MAGIVSVGGYIPRYRLTGEMLAGQWGGSPKGGRSVANHDEDSITMAAEAVRGALEVSDAKSADGLYFASTSMPYTEKGNAAFIATVADLKEDAHTADFGGGLRAGAQALRAACDAVDAGRSETVAVAAADLRLGAPGNPHERFLGDAAAALVIGKENVIADIIDIHSTNREFVDVWRTPEDRFVKSADAKFIQDAGYARFMAEAARTLLERNSVKPDDLAAVAAYAPDARTMKTVARSLKVDPAKVVNVMETVGDSGAAKSLLDMISALENSQPGDKILVLAHSSGADAVLLQATDKIESYRSRRSVADQLKRGAPISSYAKYLSFRNILPGEKLNVWTAPPVLWREEKENYRLIAKKCDRCEAVQYPVRRVCWKCGALDDMSDMKLQTKGKVYTFTKDHMPPSPDPPTVMVSADLKGGGRFYTQLTDCDPDEVKIGMDVELTLRKIHEGGGFHNYFWKFRPADI